MVADRGTERTMRLEDGDMAVPAPMTESSYDTAVEAALRAFEAIDLDWTLKRELAPLDAGERVLIPDFAFDFEPAGADAAAFRVHLEIMGFWTPAYVRKKLDHIGALNDVDLLVAVHESLGVGDDLETAGSRVVTYRDSVGVKPVVEGGSTNGHSWLMGHGRCRPSSFQTRT